jgi:hypothetical protein
MEKQDIIYIGLSQVAAYDTNNIPQIDIPPGWPERTAFTGDSPIFKYNQEQLKTKFNIELPVYWNEMLQTKSTEESNLLTLNFNYHKFSDELIDGKVKFVYDTIENLLNENKPFYYVIYIRTNHCFSEKSFGLGENIKEGVSRGLCKVLILFLREGYLSKVDEVQWLSHFGQANNLTPSNFIFTHSNLRFQETINKTRTENVKINFTYIPLNYFEYNPWFLASGKSPFIPEYNMEFKKVLPSFIESNRNKKINKYFNILNRRPRQHRILLFTEIMSNMIIKDKCEISLGVDEINSGLVENNSFIIDFLQNIVYTYPEYNENLKFAKTHDFTVPVELDVNLKENRAGEYTRLFYENTFCSLTSETLVSSDVLFFSEKTFKPIYNLHPFLFLGNPFSLKKLKEFGYLTFDKWWDESYDNEIDYLKRIKKITNVMEEISTWSIEKCINVTQEMEEVLIHNFYNFMDNKRFDDYVTKLFNLNGVKSKQNLL